MTEQPTYFKTMIEPKTEAKQQLLGWTPPGNEAFVLMELPQWNIVAGGAKKKTHGLTTVYVEGRPDKIHLVDQYISKGGRVLHYGNFPRYDGPEKRARIARLYSQGSGINPWDTLEKQLKQRMGLESHAELKEKEEQIRSLEARVEALTKQQAKEKENGDLHKTGAVGGQAEGGSDGEVSPKSRKQPKVQEDSATLRTGT